MSATAGPPSSWVDNHCHLPPGGVGDEWVAAAGEAGVVRFVDVGTTVERSRQAVASARARPGIVFATAGVHPHDAIDGIDGLAALLANDAVVAVGECGLDYHYDHSPRRAQQDVFAAQIALAHQHDLPLVIHTREAWDDTFSILDREGTPARTVFHCFTGGPDEADASLERGGLLSFSGIVTFKNADDVRAAVERTPLDRLMVETDSPYLAPEPMRGRQNQPAYLPHVGARVADVLGIETTTLAGAAWATTHAFYALPQ